MSELDPGHDGGSKPFLTIREAVLEIREEVRKLADHLDKIDRGGSIGTKAELLDHEQRIRSLERFRFAFPAAATLSVITGLAALIIMLLVH